MTAPIDWRPASEITDDRKDGRDVLLWTGYPVLCCWDEAWRDPVGHEVRGATHFADVDGPGDVTCPGR